MSKKANLFFAHGARDVTWRECIDNVVRRARELDPKTPSCCAFLELMQPDLPRAVAQLDAMGVTEITIVPLFLGLGKHAREDLPKLIEQLRVTYPAITFTQTRFAGADPSIVDALANMALSRT